MENHALFSAIVESSSDAIISKNIDGIILSWNAAATRIFGYTEAEAIGQSIHMLIPPGLRDEEDMIITNLRASRSIDHFETVRLSKDGREIPISLSVSPVKGSKGEVIGASNIARDISEQVLINLLTNAVKYSPKAESVSLSIHQTEKEVTVVIKDQGIGLTTDQQKNLFQRFYRAQKNSSVRGMGLGFYLSKWMYNSPMAMVWISAGS